MFLPSLVSVAVSLGVASGVICILKQRRKITNQNYCSGTNLNLLHHVSSVFYLTSSSLYWSCLKCRKIFCPTFLFKTNFILSFPFFLEKSSKGGIDTNLSTHFWSANNFLVFWELISSVWFETFNSNTQRYSDLRNVSLIYFWVHGVSPSYTFLLFPRICTTILLLT